MPQPSAALPQRINIPLEIPIIRLPIIFHTRTSINERAAGIMKHSYPYRETMESMLAEQQTLRFPHRLPFEMDQLQSAAAAAASNNLSLEEKAMWAARSQIILRAAAAAAVGPYAQLVNPVLVYPSAAAGTSHQQHQQAAAAAQQQLWWASSLGPTLFAAAHHQQQQQLAASSAAQQQQQHSPGGGGSGGSGPAAPRPVYPPSALSALSGHHRFSPYPSPRTSSASSLKSATQIGSSRSSPSRRTTPSPTDSLCREAQDLSPS